LTNHAAGRAAVAGLSEVVALVKSENTAQLSRLLRRELSGLESEARRRLLDSIVAACADELESGPSVTLLRNLKLVRDALREPFPSVSASEQADCGLEIDEFLRVDERSFLVRGWIADSFAGGEVTLVSPEGSSAEISRSLLHHERPDIDRSYANLHGFVSYFWLDVASRLDDDWIVELRDPTGSEVEVEAPPVVSAPLEVRELITRALRDVLGDKRPFVRDHAYPALVRVQERIAKSVAIETLVSCGDPPSAPEVSIVVPLLDRLDALEHQLAQVSGDPDMLRSDLIYVLDSLEDADELAPKASELHNIYEAPFRLTTLTGKAGTTVMVNAAASLARGRKLLILHPDVVPGGRGWLGKLSAFHDSRDRIGAVGPMLLYEDGSLHHAGLRFEPASPQELRLLPLPDGEIWDVRARFKGLPGTLAEAGDARPVAAVSGACLMIDRKLFEEVGGLRNIYAEGQNEAVDLCLRLLDAGRSNWYLPDVRMYYLEGRSELEPSLYARQYNALLLSHLWGERLRSEHERGHG
jgi:hypothetical protein